MSTAGGLEFDPSEVSVTACLDAPAGTVLPGTMATVTAVVSNFNVDDALADVIVSVGGEVRGRRDSVHLETVTEVDVPVVAPSQAGDYALQADLANVSSAGTRIRRL